MINYADTSYELIYEADDITKLDDYILHDKRFEIFILDKKFNIIYPPSTNIKIQEKQEKKGFFTKDGYYFYSKTIELEGIKNVHNIVIKADTIEKELQEIKQTIAIFLFSSILFFSLIIFILSKLFLRPLRQYIELQNRFITDATHELNTPISVLSMSLERIDSSGFSKKNLKSIEHIGIAVKTLSHLYKDLTFIMFGIEETNRDKLAIDELINQRIAYFEPLASAKQIYFEKLIKPCELYVDERLMGRIIDNLLSNAIKYNKRGGEIKIILNQNALTIADTGIGFEQSQSEEIFKRYKRIDSTNGGFGVGLSIVKSLCDFYNITIVVESQIDKGTSFYLSWKNSRIVHA